MELKTTYRVANPDLEAARTLAWNAFVGSFTPPEGFDGETAIRQLAGEVLRVLGHPETVPHPFPRP